MGAWHRGITGVRQMMMENHIRCGMGGGQSIGDENIVGAQLTPQGVNGSGGKSPGTDVQQGVTSTPYFFINQRCRL